MSDNLKIQFIHGIRELNRLWKTLSKEQKRDLLEIMQDEISTTAVLIALRTIKRAR